MSNISTGHTRIKSDNINTIQLIETNLRNFGLNWPNTSIFVDPNDEHWYSKRIQLWGTKWDLDKDNAEIIRTCKNVVCIRSDWAWKGPDNWIKWLATTYPEISIAHQETEPAMGFALDILCSNGSCSEMLTHYCEPAENSQD